MADDPVATALAEIRARNERRIEFYAYTEYTVEHDAAEGDVRRLLAALEEVLKLAGDARPTSFSVVGTGPLKPIAWDLDPEKLGAAILAELTGKGKGNA